MTRRVLRVALAVPLLAIGLGASSAAARGGPAAPVCAHAASLYHAGIVVAHRDGQVVHQCVGFDTATITALAVLQASGIEYAVQTYGSLGDAVCQIDNEPLNYIQCLPSSGWYWVFFVSRAGGQWANSSLGVSNATLRNGDVVGFRSAARIPHRRPLRLWRARPRNRHRRLSRHHARPRKQPPLRPPPRGRRLARQRHLRGPQRRHRLRVPAPRRLAPPAPLPPAEAPGSHRRLQRRFR
jgi:hypothetical protein